MHCRSLDHNLDENAAGQKIRCRKRLAFRHGSQDLVERTLKWWLIHAQLAPDRVSHLNLDVPGETETPTFAVLETMAADV